MRAYSSPYCPSAEVLLSVPGHFTFWTVFYKDIDSDDRQYKTMPGLLPNQVIKSLTCQKTDQSDLPRSSSSRLYTSDAIDYVTEILVGSEINI